MLVGSATKSVIAGSRPRATGCCASQPTRSSGNARQCWKRSTPPSPKPLRRRFAPAPPRPAGRRPDSPCLNYSGSDSLEGALQPGRDVGPAHARELVQHGSSTPGELIEGLLVGPLLDHQPLVEVLTVAVGLDARATER